MSNRTVLFKLTAGYTVIVLISLLTVGLIFAGYYRADILDNRTTSMQARGQQIAALARDQLLASDDPQYLAMASQLLHNLAGARIIISDESGRIRLDSAGAPGDASLSAEQQAAAPLMARILQGENLAEEIIWPAGSESHLAVGIPVRDATGAVSGGVLMLSPASGMDEMMDQALYMLGAAILLALLLTALMSFFYGRLFTRPLQSMQLAAMEMARGNYETRVRLKPGDEIGQLGETLDLLATRLGYTIDQLFQEQSKLQDLFASISEGILAFDPRMRLLSHNLAALVILGYERQDNWEIKLLDGINKTGITPVLTTVMEKGERGQITTIWNQLVLSWIISPITNKRGEIVGSVALIRDISESENLERMRRDFVANVSHELRTPLTVIRGSAEALLDGAVSDPDDVLKYNRRILNEIRGLERLVSDLLDLNQLQSGKMVLHPESLDLAALVRDVVQALEPIARNKKIALSNGISEILPSVYGDYDRMRQLLIIFIDNAIRHSPGDSRVWIEAESGRQLRLKVNDSGPGIPAADLPYVWDRFYKADKARPASGGGTGLGLSIARSLVELQGGSVRLDSVYGQGTTVIIDLPLEHSGD